MYLSETDRLHDAAVVALLADDGELEDLRRWFDAMSARELLRTDTRARTKRHDGPRLLDHRDWTPRVLEHSDVSAAVASMHPDGRVRERAVRRLAGRHSRTADRALAVRADDHARQVRDPAVRALLSRLELEQAVGIVPVLHRLASRTRGAAAHGAYLAAAVERHGPAALWAALRDSDDRDVRRDAFRRSLDLGLLTVADAVALLPTERDPVVQRTLGRTVADRASPADVRAVLLASRSAEGRALALFRLDAAALDPDDVEPRLVDRSVLVRFWARRRWTELGRDPAAACREATRAGSPAARARAWAALAETGAAIARDDVLPLLRSDEVALRAAGLRLLAGRAEAHDVGDLLARLRSPHAREARLAGEALLTAPRSWGSDDLGDLWAADEPTLRRRAWWLQRSRGGWDRVLADLAILRDADRELVALGRTPPAPAYGAPTPEQRERLATLLPDARLPRDVRLVLAVTGGLDGLAADLRRQPAHPTVTRPTAVGPTRRRRWWRRR